MVVRTGRGLRTPKRLRRSLAQFQAGERFPDPDTEDGRLIYDAILASRGQSPDFFRQAAPDFISLVRFAVFAEKAGAALADMETVTARTVDKGIPPKDRLALIQAKSAVAEVIPVFRDLLYPEDEPVG